MQEKKSDCPRTHEGKKTGPGKPRWLRRRLPAGAEYGKVSTLLKDGGLHTVCQEAGCPNIWECFSCQTATFLIMGPRCTRNCRFCAVEHEPQGPPDPGEPDKVSRAAERMGLDYVVVTSVTRDDLPDGGASFFAETIHAVRKRIPHAQVEVLVPDFQGNADAISIVAEARPNVLNHNMETARRLYPLVRPGADYRRSLSLLRQISPSVPAKSGLMLGLGEKPDEVGETLKDILDTGCRILTLGQYLQPTKAHLPVERFVPPGEFEDWRQIALKTGFSHVASGPFVRSSYHAKELCRT